jgi:hypothetical protein
VSLPARDYGTAAEMLAEAAEQAGLDAAHRDGRAATARPAIADPRAPHVPGGRGPEQRLRQP